MRQVKISEEQRHRSRIKLAKRSVSGLVVAGIVVLLVVLLSDKAPSKTAASTSTSTTTTLVTPSTSTTTTVPVANGLVTVSTPTKPVCPPVGGTAKRYTSFTTAPPTCIDTAATYEATIKTDVGSFTVKFDTQTSTEAVNNFIFLARNHFYDSTIFQRVIPNFMDQGGDPTGTGTGGPGYSWTGNTPNSSCTAKADCYPIGSVAMANSGATSSNGSQFFIVTGTEGEQLPASYTLFGQVISGMSVVQKINADGNANASANGVPPKVTHHIISIAVTQL
jgi:cyclophilin family peptidyl-prolyl cis-trans isomerase